MTAEGDCVRGSALHRSLRCVGLETAGGNEIARLRAENEELRQRIEKVKEQHVACDCETCSGACAVCDGLAYPCLTVRILSGEDQ